MNLPEDQDPLWDLLAKSPPPSPSPRFVSKTTRAVRELAQGGGRGGLSRWIAWLRPSETRSPWGLPLALGATAAFAVAVAVVVWQGDAPDGGGELVVTGSVAELPRPFAEVDAFDPATEIDAVEHLAQLMAITDPDSLSDELFADLLF